MKKFTSIIPVREGILTAFLSNSFKTYLFGFINNAAISLGTTAGIILGVKAVVSVYRSLMELLTKDTTTVNSVFIRTYNIISYEEPDQSIVSQLKNIKVDDSKALASIVGSIKKSKKKVIVRSDDGKQFHVQSFGLDSFKDIENRFKLDNVQYKVVKTIDVIKEFKRNGNLKLPAIVSEQLIIEKLPVFLKRRKKLPTIIASFRKKQIGKETWRKHRLKTHWAIKRWHRSLAGRKFHRKLNRFNLTRINRPKNTSLLRSYRRATEGFNSANESVLLINMLRSILDD